jgi:pimeloyl-ACP methyl ester carboxylesterase
MLRSRIVFIASALAICAASPAVGAQQSVAKPDTSGYIAANGVNYWFEIRGAGEPLLLLHGGLYTTDMFGPVLAKLAEHRRVIGIHLYGHGRTVLGTRKISPVDMGRDLGIVLQKLGLRQIDVMGHSLGGSVAFQLAVQYPALVRRLVLVSTPYAQSGWFAEMLTQQAAVSGAMADGLKDTPMYKSYAAVAPRRQDFPRLLDAMGEFMRQPYDWSASVKQLTMPVMLVYGDGDMVRPEHMVSFYHLLGGGLRDAGWMREHMSKNRLAILPNLTHYEIGAAPVLAATVLPFLNGEYAAKTSPGKMHN